MTLTPVVTQIDRDWTLIGAGSGASGRCFATMHGAVAELRDDHLRQIGSRQVIEGRLLAADRLERLVIRAEDSLHFFGDNGHVVCDLRADGGCLIGDLALIAAPAETGHLVLLVDPDSGDILDTVSVDADEASAFVWPHPSGSGAIVDFAMGQDGVMACWVEIVEGALTVTEILQRFNPVTAGFNPSGTQLLILPQPDDLEQASVVGWPSLELTGTLTATELQTEIGLGMVGCWIDDHRVALYAMEDSLLVADDSLSDPARVSLPIELGDNGDIQEVQHLGHGRIAARIWRPGEQSTMILDFNTDC